MLSTFPTRFFIAMAACLGLFGSTSVAAGAQEGGVRSRELVRDPGILVVRVFEADGSPSPQRTLSLIAGTDGTGGAALGTDFGEGEERGPGEVRTGDDGRAQFERTHSLSAAQRYTGDSQVQVWVSAGHRIIHRQTFDLAKTLELEVHLAEQARVIVNLDGMPPEIYPQLVPAMPEGERANYYDVRQGDRLPTGEFRFDGLELNQEWTLSLACNFPVYQMADVHPSDRDLLSGQTFFGPKKLGVDMHLSWEPQDEPLLHGRFLDELGAPLALSGSSSAGVLLTVTSASGVDQLFAVVGFSDGQFFAGPMRGEEVSLPIAAETLYFRWTPPDTLGDAEYERFMNLDERMKVERARLMHFDREVGAELIELGDVVLQKSGALFEARVVSASGEAIEGASLNLLIPQRSKTGEERWGYSATFYQRKTLADGLVRYFAPSWESALRTGNRVEADPNFQKPEAIRLAIQADGYVARTVDLELNATKHEVVLQKGRVIRGRLRSKHFATLRADSSTDIVVVAVERGQGAMGSSEPLAEQRFLGREYLNGEWVDFELKDLPQGSFDLVVRTYAGSWDLARVNNIASGATQVEIDVDAQMQWAKIALHSEATGPLGPRELEGSRWVSWDNPSGRGSAYMTPAWVEGRQWIPLCSANPPMKLRLQLSSYADVHFDALVPGEHSLETHPTFKLRVDLEGGDEAFFKKTWNLQIVPEGRDRPESFYEPGKKDRAAPVYGELLPGLHELRWMARDRQGDYVTRLTQSIELTRQDFDRGSIAVTVPPEFVSWVLEAP